MEKETIFVKESNKCDVAMQLIKSISDLHATMTSPNNTRYKELSNQLSVFNQMLDFYIKLI